MVKKIRKKFIWLILLAAVCILTLLIGVINVINYHSVIHTADSRIAFIADRGGDLDTLKKQMQQPPVDEDPSEPKKGFDDFFSHDPIGEETAFDTRYFTVTVDAEGQITAVNVSNIITVDEEAAESMAEKLYQAGKTRGFSGDYRYQLTELTSDEDVAPVEYMYIFLDASRELASFESFRNASILISLVGILLLYVLATVISGYVVRPMSESYEKQKRFITEASHEIKTPIAIIQANTEVIELENGENDWTRGIRKQTKRLTELTDNLVTMSRMEEDDPLVLSEDVDLSKLVKETVESYEAPAVANNKNLDVHIADGIHLTGDAKMLTKMISMLMDNAIKYSADGSDIRVSLAKTGRKRVFTVTNAVDHIEPGQHPELFDRFYRADSSHNSKNKGSGIGLAMARSIAEAHGGRIQAFAADEHTISFAVEL